MPPKRVLTDEQKKRKVENQKRRRENKTLDEKQHERQNNSLRESQRRQTLSDSERNLIRQKNAQQHKDAYRPVQRIRNCIALATTEIVDENVLAPHNCGKLDTVCDSCGAKHFLAEQPTDKKFTVCCQKGKVNLQPIRVSSLIEDLLTRKHAASKNFHENIRSINSALAFASMGAKIVPPPGYGPYCFRINGQIYHRTGTLHPANDDQRKFAQLYILDPEEASKQRLSMQENTNCNKDLMRELSEFMATTNPFAQACKMLYEVEQESIDEAKRNGSKESTVSMAIVQDRTSDKRRYNSPTANEVAIIFQNSDGEPPLERDLIIHCRANDDQNLRKTERISVLDPNLEPMVYPLLFPYGDQSWWINIPLNYNPSAIANLRRQQSSNPRTRVTQMQYYGYRLSIRQQLNQFLSAGKLTQQYIVDAYVKTEANRLNFCRQNQSALRVEEYTGLMDHFHSESAAKGLQPGKAVILPSSFQGSPRNMQQNYQDAMAIVRKYGKPDLFITMTCNPKWDEIQENLESGQSAEFRPDLVARVFNLKLKELLNDITKKHVLGIPTAIVHVIEFQKRGLPHAHILLILKDEYKPKDSDIIDNIISAEIPDEQTFPKLHAIITKHMVHGPCGVNNINSPCMANGKCSKNFPKNFQAATVSNFNGYPIYRRRETTEQTVVKGKPIDNTWIVPHNRYLSLKYNCHINVESCASVQSVKYLFKYIYKGHDCANVEIVEKGILQHDEIKSFMDSRYVSAPEAAWRLFGFPMHEQSHTIIRLPVHLPGKHCVYFTEENAKNAVVRAANRETMLTAWFKLNQEDETAHDYLYSEIPQYYVFDKKECHWKQRQRGGNNTIGRMYSVSISNDPEKYCERLLLLHVRGATSFEDLRSFEGIEHETFKEAAQSRGLFNDDNTWTNTLDEAVTWKMPRQLRDLFAYICIFAVPSNALELFNKYKNDLIEDVCSHEGHLENCSLCENFALSEIQATLIIHGKSCSDFGLPAPSFTSHSTAFNSFNILLEQTRSIELENSLNFEQKIAFDRITNAINNDSLPHRCFFLDGPGGSGKTYLYKTLICHIRGNEGIVLPVASTGIAANLLDGGRTYHSQFKLPVPLLDTSTSSMRLTSSDAELFRKAKLLIWDEATMAPSLALNAVDKLLKEVMRNDKPFGGKTLLLGGDFRQTLPVVPHGSRSAIVQASIKFSYLWDKFEILKLKNNVRSVDPQFSEWLIDLGNGTLASNCDVPEDTFEIPEEMVCRDSIVTEIFGTSLKPDEVGKFSKQAILCPKNSDVDSINEEVLDLLEGEKVSYLSCDSIDDDSAEDRQNYPVEFLNSLAPSGMPIHCMNLKKGSIIMLLRNLNTKRGLCNGTRLIVKELKPNLILAEVLTGTAEKEIVFIPRIDLAPANTELPFVLRRRQFPIKLAFAMTINKSQGQTLEIVGIYLNDPVFSHGQMYVAFSRVRRACDVKVKVIHGPHQGNLVEGSESVYTKNVVYREIFTKDQ